MRELSIFCDESGDFGPYDHHCPYYILTLVFHDQSIDISNEVSLIEEKVSNLGFDSETAIHTAPLIRRESEFISIPMRERRKLFDALFSLFNHCNISFQTFVVEKREFGSGDSLAERLAKIMGEFLRENLEYFQGFDRIVVYYDKGQKEITRTLKIIFSSNMSNVEFRIVQPNEYRLFQVADLVCTLELVGLKRVDKAMSFSEKDFFINMNRLKKIYLRKLERKRF